MVKKISMKCGLIQNLARVRNEQGEFEGVLEYVQDIQPYRDIDTDYNRDL